MGTDSIPSYPVIHINVAADGSAHVNVAGRHIDYPPGAINDTRTAIKQYAVEMARTLGRAVRMTTTDPAGTFKMAAHPDGTLTELDVPEGKPRRRRKVQAGPRSAAETVETPVTSSQPATAPALPSESAPPLAVDADVELTRMVARKPAMSTATLTFETGEQITVTSSVLLGRRPTPLVDEKVDTLAALGDTTATMSKTHFRGEWHQGQFWIADRDTANGTIVERPHDTRVILTAWEPYELHEGDAVVIGEVRFTVTLEHPEREGRH